MQDEKDLAARILANADAGKSVRLTPQTAYFVGLKLMTASEKPTHREIVQIICDSKCSTSCYPCSGKANIICRAYGQRVEDAPLRRQPG